MVRMALEMVPTSIDMLGSDIQQGTAGHTEMVSPSTFLLARDVVCRAMPRQRKRVRAN